MASRAGIRDGMFSLLAYAATAASATTTPPRFGLISPSFVAYLQGRAGEGLSEYDVRRIFESVQRLSRSALEAVVRLAGEIATLDDREQRAFPEPLVESLRNLVGCEWATYAELDRPGERMLVEVTLPEGEQADSDAEVFWRLRHEHPLCSYEDQTGDFSARKLSDFVTRRELKRLQIYTDWLRPLGIEHVISVGLPAPFTHTKMFLFDNGADRGDFEERERTILELLRPHLIRRYEQVRARRRAEVALAALELSDEPLVLMGAEGPEFATPRGRRLLASHRLDVSDVPNVHPLVVRELRPNVLLLEERRPLGLTPREREVLALVAEGKTNAQIAALVWISRETVRKHLENAYAKLGVSSRMAAVRTLREHGHGASP